MNNKSIQSPSSVRRGDVSLPTVPVLAAATTHSHNIPIPNNTVVDSSLKELEINHSTILPTKHHVRRTFSVSDSDENDLEAPIQEANISVSAPNLSLNSLPQLSTKSKTMAEAVGVQSKETVHNPAPIGPTKVTSASPIFPSKDQAIIIQSVEGVTIAQYLNAVASIVGPKNVLFASRMSLGRVAFYFKTIRQVDEIILNHGGIVIGDQFLSARRMITRAERLVLSNVCPSIPHEVLVSQLSKIVKVVSPINFISLGVKENGLDHVLSFRRQLYIVREENRQLADSLLVPFDGETYRVFLSLDDVKCFKCRKPGHVARNCPVVVEQQSSESATDINASFPLLKNTAEKRKAPPSSTTTGDAHVDNVISINPLVETEILSPNTELLPSDFSQEKMDETPSILSDSAIQSKGKLNKNKKFKPSDGFPEDIVLPEEAIEILNNSATKNVLSVSAFLHFLAAVKGNDRPLTVAQRFTDDVPGLIEMLLSIKPAILKERAIKERIKRLIANLRKALDHFIATGDDSASLTRSLSNESLTSNLLV